MLGALSQGVRRTDRSASPKAVGSLCSVGRAGGCQDGEKGPEWKAESLFLIWVLPLYKSPLIYVPQAPICKMGERDHLVSDRAPCPMFPEQKEGRQWVGGALGRGQCPVVSPSGGGNLAVTGVTQRSSKHKPKQAPESKSIPAYPPFHASFPSVLDL